MTPRFLVGDRVVFREGHPWYGYAGVVREVIGDESVIGPGWYVEVDGQYGLRSFAREDELKIVSRTTEGD